MAKDSCFTLDQMGKLREIEKARLTQGQPGLRDDVQELIRRLTSGGVAGKSDDPRIIQAKRLWDLGFGRELNAKCLWDLGFGRVLNKTSFEEYLKDIPEIPEGLVKDDPAHPLLVLVDPRLGISKSCGIIGIRFGHTDKEVFPCDDRHATPQTPFWVRFHDGRRNRNRRPSDCRKECVGNTFAATAMVGIMAYCHHPDILKESEYDLDLPGSVFLENRDGGACLARKCRRTWLGVIMHDFAHPDSGSGGFRRE